MTRINILIVALLCAVPLSVSAQQLRLNRQQKFHDDMPAGNYSGITPIGDDRYAVVSDKTADGFYVFHISIDSVSGRIVSVGNEGFRPSGHDSRDQEGIAWCPRTHTLFISGEADNQILEYDADGRRTGRRLQVPATFSQLSGNYGERPARSDSLLRLTAFDDSGRVVAQYAYALDGVKPKRRGTLVNGVSELCALGDGRLLVLERTLRVTPLKIGSYAETRLYVVSPTADAQPLAKSLLCSFRTRINLFRRNFANYEGLCVARRCADGTLVLLLIADSQNRYRGLLRDWLRTIVVNDSGG